MSAGKIVALVSGILIVLVALALVVPGAVLLGLYGTQRDSDGFFQTSSRVLATDGSALVTPDVDLNLGPAAGPWLPLGDRAAIRIEAEASSDSQLFVGIGPSSDVAGYLDGVEYDEVTEFGWGWDSIRYRHMDGSAPASPPGEEDFWVAEQEGSGIVTLDWDIEDGNWTAVVMNTDGSAPVRAAVSLGARFDILLSIGIGMTVGGVILLGVGILLIVIGAKRPKTPVAPQPQAVQQMAGPRSGVTAGNEPTPPESPTSGS